jgi:hypothetical protein
MVLFGVQQLELLFVEVRFDLSRVPVHVDVSYLGRQELDQRHCLVFFEFVESHEGGVRLDPGFTLCPFQLKIYLFVFLDCSQDFHWDVIFEFAFDFHFLWKF